MARALRIEYPGAFYHVINRGQRQEAIVDDIRDRQRFLSCLERMSNLFGVKLHTFCLMTNHYHLILETPEANLSRAIQWLNVSYAVYYNRRHQCAGHLFQGRFKAILIEANTYLETLSRYIHLNPVRVGLVKQPWSYPWSSCRHFVSALKQPHWLTVNRVLQGFGRSRQAQRTRYRQYLLESDTENPSHDVVGGMLLGSEVFLDWAKHTFLGDRPQNRHIPVMDKLRPKADIERITKLVAQHYHVPEASILRRGAKRNEARDVAIYLSRELSGHNCQTLGVHFGDVSGAAISARYNHVVEAMKKNQRFKREVYSIRKTVAKTDN